LRGDDSAAGLRVTVIDQGAIDAACSGGNCGYICPSHVLPLSEPGSFGVAIRSLFNPDAPFRVKPRLRPCPLELDVAGDGAEVVRDA
jgi:D-amino-acid dehydrogenase